MHLYTVCFPAFFFSNVVLGRKAQDIRICACPGRDRTIEETAEAKRRSTQPAATSVISQTTAVTPPLTPQALSAPHTPPEEPTTSNGETSHAQIPKLTKKRCKCGVPCTIPKGKGWSLKWLGVPLLFLDGMLVLCRLQSASAPSIPHIVSLSCCWYPNNNYFSLSSFLCLCGETLLCPIENTGQTKTDPNKLLM